MKQQHYINVLQCQTSNTNKRECNFSSNDNSIKVPFASETFRSFLYDYIHFQNMSYIFIQIYYVSLCYVYHGVRFYCRSRRRVNNSQYASTNVDSTDKFSHFFFYTSYVVFKSVLYTQFCFMRYTLCNSYLLCNKCIK